MTIAFDALDAPASPLARLDPRWKLAGLMILGVAVVVVRDPATTLLAALAALALLAIARPPMPLIRSRLLAFLIFLTPFLVLLPIIRGREGLLTAGVIACRAFALFAVALIIVATAPFHRTLQAAQALGAPRLFTQMILLSYRYLFVLRDEFVRIRTALRVRGFRAGTARRTYRTIGLVAGSLMLRGDERAERVAQAMRCRGFDGRFRSLTSFRTRPIDAVFFAAVAGFGFALVAADLALRS